MELPMFPLGSVLFPGQILPLHIFETRYQRMLASCLKGNREFGVVLIERGHEVGGGDIRSMVGTVARIVQAVQVQPGHWAVISVGMRRLRVTEWLPDDPWPHAEVADYPDPDADAGADLAGWDGLRESFRTVVALSSRLGRQLTEEAQDLSDRPGPGSFHVAVLAPIGEFDQQQVLAARSVADRVSLLSRQLADVEQDLRAELALDDG